MLYLSHGMPAGELRVRIDSTRTAVADRGLAALFCYGDALRTSNVGYFTDYRPLDGVSDIAMGVVFLPLDDEPTLFVGGSCLSWAREVTEFETRDLRDLPAIIREWSRRNGKGDAIGIAGNEYIPARLLHSVEDSIGDRTLKPTDALAQVKAVKSEWEVAQLRRAAEFTDVAITAIGEALADGPKSERELARQSEIAMLQAGADAVGYRSMVQSGPRAAHNLALPTDRVLQPGDLVMTDIGARYRGYVADGGRGFGYGKIDAERRAIIEASVTAVEAGLAAVRPGLTADHLNQIIQGSIMASGYAEYSNEAKGHGTGHGTGMDPEEELPWIAPDQDIILKPNMVFTLKATITVPDIGGLRTERIVRVTADGCEALDKCPMRLNF